MMVITMMLMMLIKDQEGDPECDVYDDKHLLMMTIKMIVRQLKLVAALKGEPFASALGKK